MTTLRGGDIWYLGGCKFQLLDRLPLEIKTPSGKHDWAAQDLESGILTTVSAEALLASGNRLVLGMNEINLQTSDWAILTDGSPNVTAIAVGDYTLRGVLRYDFSQSFEQDPILSLGIPICGKVDIQVNSKFGEPKESEND